MCMCMCECDYKNKWVYVCMCTIDCVHVCVHIMSGFVMECVITFHNESEGLQQCHPSAWGTLSKPCGLQWLCSPSRSWGNPAAHCRKGYIPSTRVGGGEAPDVGPHDWGVEAEKTVNRPAGMQTQAKRRTQALYAPEPSTQTWGTMGASPRRQHPDVPPQCWRLIWVCPMKCQAYTDTHPYKTSWPLAGGLLPLLPP